MKSDKVYLFFIGFAMGAIAGQIAADIWINTILGYWVIGLMLGLIMAIMMPAYFDSMMEKYFNAQ